jgi:hypothetical protein
MKKVAEKRCISNNLILKCQVLLFHTNFQPEDYLLSQDLFLTTNHHVQRTYGIRLLTRPIIGAGNVKEHEAAKYGPIVTTHAKLTPDHVVPLSPPGISS